MLFKQNVLREIAAGRVTLAFRRWRRPTVRAGGHLTTPAGVLAIEAVDEIAGDTITEADAVRAGYASRMALLEALGHREGALYRIAFHIACEDPRIALRGRVDLNSAEVAAILSALTRLDRSSRHGAWTEAVLRLIAQSPGVRAAELAARADRETGIFKRDVRKLKGLGLTQSLEVGYRLSPRGHAVLRILGEGAPGR